MTNHNERASTMTETAHTPGPWRAGCITDPQSACDCASILDEGRYMGGIAQVYVHNGIDNISQGGNDCPPRDEAIANALLIAAAPDMFGAMTEFCRRVDAGEVRSVRTYTAFKAILGNAIPAPSNTEGQG